MSTLAWKRTAYAAKKASGVCVDTGCWETATRGVRCLYHGLLRRLKARVSR